MRLLLRILALPILIVIANTKVSSAVVAGIGDEDMVRLQRGEILLQSIHADQPGKLSPFHSSSAFLTVLTSCLLSKGFIQNSRIPISLALLSDILEL